MTQAIFRYEGYEFRVKRGPVCNFNFDDIPSKVNKVFFKILKQIEKRGWQILFYPPIFRNLSGKTVKVATNTLGCISIMRRFSSVTRIFLTTMKCGKTLAGIDRDKAFKTIEKSTFCIISMIRDYLNFFVQWAGLIAKVQTVVINVFLKVIAIFTFVKNLADIKNYIVKIIKTSRLFCIKIEGGKEKEEILKKYATENLFKLSFKLLSSLLSIAIAVVILVRTIFKSAVFKKIYWILTSIGIGISFFIWVMPLFFRYRLEKIPVPNYIKIEKKPVEGDE